MPQYPAQDGSSTVTDVLENVLSKALPILRGYLEPYQREWTSELWSELEDEIGRVYRGYLRSLLPDPHVDRSGADLPYTVERPSDPPFGGQVTLGAINQRGLFRQNGRATLLEPCGDFSPRTKDPVRHDALHHVYMHLVSKSESINQLFLATTSLRSLAVTFGGTESPRIQLSRDKLHGTVDVPEVLASLLAPVAVRERWRTSIRGILTHLDIEKIANAIHIKGRFPPELAALAEPQNQPGQLDPLDVIRKWPNFFSEWLSLYPETLQNDGAVNDRKGLRNIEEAGILFKSWLRSIAWLMFYCQKDVAGGFFYTVRLPRIILRPARVLPETSLSVVCKEPLSGVHLTQLRATFQAVEASAAFGELREIANSSIERFRSKRLGNVETERPADKSHAALRPVLEKLYLDHDDLPVDFRQLYFLLNLARSLVGQRHEGQSLRFCLIHGFGFARVDAESNGAIQEFRADLLHRWQRFLGSVQLPAGGAGAEPKIQDVGQALAKWIKANDLQLQRPDVAVYLEEVATSDLPLPVGLVQVRYLSTDELHPVGTELELRQALRDITLWSHRTVAIVTATSGLFLFIKGACILVRCSGREDWDDPFYVYVTGEHEPLERQIEADLQKTFSETFPDRPNVAKQAATAIRYLCEALVSMGHGAMFVVRPKQEGEDSVTLPPLNPVWLIRSRIDTENFTQECAIYALMAALDGATELLLPLETTGSIEFRCRRYAQTLQKDWVWSDDPDEPGHAVPLNVALSTMLVGKGTRHHTALVLSKRLKDSLVLTVSADGPVTIFKNGAPVESPSGILMRFAP